MGKLVIFSAPSGSGKTTIVRELLQRFPRLEFSVSATSRAPRGKERNGVDYFFLSPRSSARPCRKINSSNGRKFTAGPATGPAQRDGADLAKRQRNRFRRGRDRRAQPQTYLRRSGLRDLHHASLHRNSARAARQAGHRFSRNHRMQSSQGGVRTHQSSPKFDHVVINDDLAQAIEEATCILSDFLAR